MAEKLRSVGLDVGTTSTQLVVSELTVENRASCFAVPDFSISGRKILYESPVYFTPLIQEDRIDGQGIRKIVEREYKNAGIRREDVQTGAVIVTGETSRKENADQVLAALSSFAGDFVVATAGPDLESRLAAKGAGAAEYSKKTGKTVLHVDIGGGTSNFALIREGEIVDTGCLNVGGRLVKYREDRVITWVSPALKGMFSLKPGDTLEENQAEKLADRLTRVLEMASGLRSPDGDLERLITREGKLPDPELLKERPVLSFSGGVADCMKNQLPWDCFGDLGPSLGKCILKSRLCAGAYILGEQTIRATVIGAGCHSAQLSGSTVFCQNVDLPLKNLETVHLTWDRPVKDQIREGLKNRESERVFFLGEGASPTYEGLQKLAEEIAAGADGRPVYLCLQQDMAKALGQMLALTMGKAGQILCLDRILLREESYLDVGKPVGPAIPVVVKTLILGKGNAYE